eukprot:CAMPEP_0115103966 /NCGR_PEP_ID=MMETSP0227-20121206/34964_1 /TAXON_ID=89957 /ORGANISM="Polarella glacialis, Strain CCMP 1383" /LENGTH=107 /DNA_ID=CAMNT_0002500653 /DNA_START=141 /DNA_END=464 /DNA_ORIENTATION=+
MTPSRCQFHHNSAILHPKVGIALTLVALVRIRVLDHDQDVIPVWCHHDLVLLGADPEKGQVILGVQVTNHTACLGRQLGDECGVLQGLPAVEGGTDWHTLAVDNDNP